METKVFITIAIIYVLLCLFVLGMQVGMLLDLKEQRDAEKSYFDYFPSPLACHVDNSCSLKDVQ